MSQTVYEQCPYCGGFAAWMEGDTILVSHNCDEQPPGPVDPPRRYSVDSVEFIRGEFTTEQWQKEHDAAFTLIKILKQQRLDYADRLRCIRDEIRGFRDWRDS